MIGGVFFYQPPSPPAELRGLPTYELEVLGFWRSLWAIFHGSRVDRYVRAEPTPRSGGRPFPTNATGGRSMRR